MIFSFAEIVSSRCDRTKSQGNITFVKAWLKLLLYMNLHLNNSLVWIV